MIFNSEISTRRKLAYFFGVDVDDVICNELSGFIRASFLSVKNPINIRNLLKYIRVNELYVQSSDLNLLPHEIIASQLSIVLDKNIDDSKVIMQHSGHINISENALIHGSLKIEANYLHLQFTKIHRGAELDWLSIHGHNNVIRFNVTYKLGVSELSKLSKELKGGKLFGLELNFGISEILMWDIVSGISYRISPRNIEYAIDDPKYYVCTSKVTCGEYEIEAIIPGTNQDGYGI